MTSDQGFHRRADGLHGNGLDSLRASAADCCSRTARSRSGSWQPARWRTSGSSRRAALSRLLEIDHWGRLACYAGDFSFPRAQQSRTLAPVEIDHAETAGPRGSRTSGRARAPEESELPDDNDGAMTGHDDAGRRRVLLIPGGASTVHGYFPDLAAALATHATLIESDPPGIGGTSDRVALRARHSRLTARTRDSQHFWLGTAGAALARDGLTSPLPLRCGRMADVTAVLRPVAVAAPRGAHLVACPGWPKSRRTLPPQTGRWKRSISFWS